MLKRCASQYAPESSTNVVRFKIDEDEIENPPPSIVVIDEVMPEPEQVRMTNIINISSSMTYDGVYDTISTNRTVRRFRHDQIPTILERIIDGSIPGHHILNFDCCGGCTECGHNSWLFQSEEITAQCMDLIQKGLQLGWTVYISDFALKVVICNWTLSESILGECPFVMNRDTRFQGHINMQFSTDREFDGPFEQLRKLSEPRENIGTAQIEIINGTIRFELNPEVISQNSAIYSVKVQANEVETDLPLICELKYSGLPGKINCYGLHLSKLTYCDTTEKRLFSCLRRQDACELQTQLDMAGNNQELRMASVQRMASRTVSSY